MLRMKSIAVAIAFLLFLGVPQAQPCSWAVGYFHQITVLKGQVVGSNIALFQPVRWLRQSFVRKRAKLTLYQYCWPCALNEMVPVKTVETDNDGKFDFGVLGPGHYTLVVDEKTWGRSDRFDVEVKDLPRSTESVTIDVSPNFPDCTGGHEFIVKMK
jgi:hypothetical protein